MSKRYSNPDQFVSEMVELASQSPQDAAEVAATWRERFHNMTQSTEQILTKTASVSLTVATAFLMAAWEGMNEAAADDMAEKWLSSSDAGAAAVEAGVDLASMSDYDREKFAFDKMEERDPRKLPVIGFDKVLTTTIALGVVSAFGFAGETGSKWVGHAALGSLASFISSIGYRVGKDTKEQALANALVEA
jgi:hypothetical protein